jgi:hypothetical protein
LRFRALAFRSREQRSNERGLPTKLAFAPASGQPLVALAQDQMQRFVPGGDHGDREEPYVERPRATTTHK